MSSITMAADSTQSEQKVKKKQSKRKKHRSYSTTSSSSSDDSNDFPVTKKLKKKASKESKMNSSDSNRESDLDLSKELLTISGYVNDKEAMIENMFKSISSKKMKTMLPEILQPLSLNELKALCLEQLHVMSTKRISKILAGDDPETISSSASEEGEMEADEQSSKRDDGKSETIPSKREDVEEKTKVTELCRDSSKVVNKDGNRNKQPSKSPNDIPFNRNSEQNVDDHCTTKLATKLRGKEFKESGTTCREKVDDVKKSETSSNVTKFNPGNNINNIPTNAEDNATAMAINYDQKRRILIEETQKIKKVGEASKSQLEILELEMRARAIKAMLKAQDEHDKRLKRKSCEAESRESHFDERKPSRVKQNERSEKGTTPQRSHTYSVDKQSYDRSRGNASFEGRSNYWEKRPDEEQARKHWENRGHQREPYRHDDRRYNEWRDRYREW